MGRIGQKKTETNISKCLWYKVQLFGVTILNQLVTLFYLHCFVAIFLYFFIVANNEHDFIVDIFNKI